MLTRKWDIAPELSVPVSDRRKRDILGAIELKHGRRVDDGRTSTGAGETIARDEATGKERKSVSLGPI